MSCIAAHSFFVRISRGLQAPDDHFPDQQDLRQQAERREHEEDPAAQQGLAGLILPNQVGILGIVVARFLPSTPLGLPQS